MGILLPFPPLSPALADDDDDAVDAERDTGDAFLAMIVILYSTITLLEGFEL